MILDRFFITIMGTFCGKFDEYRDEDNNDALTTTSVLPTNTSKRAPRKIQNVRDIKNKTKPAAARMNFTNMRRRFRRT